MEDTDTRTTHEADNTDQTEDEASSSACGISTQNEFDPSLLLVNLGPLDDAASNTIEYFLRNTDDGAAAHSPEALTNIVAIYTYAAEGHSSHGIDPRHFATVLGLDQFEEDGLDRSFDPIFRKANLAAFSLLVFREDPPQYFTFGAWNQALFRSDCYNGVDDDTNFEFATELRTQMYIRAMDLQGEILGVEHKNWPDKILLGAFCVGDQQPVSFERASKFKQNLKAAQLKGWDSMESEVDERYRQRLMDHVNLLRAYTELVDDIPKADVKGLKERYPYEAFQDKYREWLKKANDQISLLNPPIGWLREVAKRLAQDYENFPDNFEQLMRDTYSEDNPGSRSPSMLQPSRRTTGTSIVEDIIEEVEEVLKEPPKSVQRMSNPIRLDVATKKALERVQKKSKASGKPAFRSSTGLMLPSASQSQPSPNRSRDRRSAPPAPVAATKKAFNINESLAKAAQQEEKENTIPPPPKDDGKRKLGRFNASQEGRTSLTFSDENEAPAGPAARPAAPQPEAETAPANENEDDSYVPEETEEEEEDEDENGDGDGDDDDDDEPEVTRATNPPRNNKRAREESDGEDEDDFAVNVDASRMRKRPRQGDRVVRHSGGRFEPQRGASRPEQRHASSTRNARDFIPDSHPGREREGSTEDEDEFPRFVPPARRTWSDREVATLIKAVRRFGTRWSAIRDEYFKGVRSDVNLKDKARNLKFEYLKSGKQLPANFEHVTIDARMLDLLRKKGLDYRNGEMRATLRR
ncbi:TTAGGG repeat binding factor [Orbilia blumenaviensis]|uniref:TTAGGG repeat binding factor n=1 Tax=Orbilia blumenaviensis TaxID=1796055 RepID=A0AAV9UHC9_9PEZI